MAIIYISPDKDEDEFLTDGALDVGRLKKLTFYSSFQVNDTTFLTWQNMLENGMDCDALRKDPKYLTHGIHPYKGKFYPQLVRPLRIDSKATVPLPQNGSNTVAPAFTPRIFNNGLTNCG